MSEPYDIRKQLLGDGGARYTDISHRGWLFMVSTWQTADLLAETPEHVANVDEGLAFFDYSVLEVPWPG